MPFDRKEYIRNYQREWLKKRRETWFADKQCAQCGSTDSLELDHADPSDKKWPSHHLIWSWSDARRQVELAKCQVLCHTCHRAKSNDENRMRRSRRKYVKCRTHGAGGYYRGCRCQKCNVAIRELVSTQRQARLESHQREQV